MLFSEIPDGLRKVSVAQARAAYAKGTRIYYDDGTRFMAHFCKRDGDDFIKSGTYAVRV